MMNSNIENEIINIPPGKLVEFEKMDYNYDDPPEQYPPVENLIFGPIELEFIDNE